MVWKLPEKSHSLCKYWKQPIFNQRNFLGVPQGSVLGPILFIIFFNDLPNCCRLLALIFADDTTLLASGENLDDLIDFVNSELHKLVTWFRPNRMCLHPEKNKIYSLSQ